MARKSKLALLIAPIAAPFMLLATPANATTTIDWHVGTAQYVKVNESHGQLVYFSVDYTDNYIHQDPISATDKVKEIDNYTGQAPDIQGWNGCANRSVHQHVPDQYTTWDNDSAGLGGGLTPRTSLHHNVTITITPVGSGPYFLWCHYEHGPETWVKLKFQDGTVFQIYWSPASYFREIYINHTADNCVMSAAADD